MMHIFFAGEINAVVIIIANIIVKFIKFRVVFITEIYYIIIFVISQIGSQIFSIINNVFVIFTNTSKIIIILYLTLEVSLLLPVSIPKKADFGAVFFGLKKGGLFVLGEDRLFKLYRDNVKTELFGIIKRLKNKFAKYYKKEEWSSQ